MRMLRSSTGCASSDKIVKAWMDLGLATLDQKEVLTKKLRQCILRSRHSGMLSTHRRVRSDAEFFAIMRETKSQSPSSSMPSTLCLMPDALMTPPDAGNLLYVPLTCHNFIKAAARASDSSLMFVVDGKWKALHSKWVFATVGLLARSHNRRRTTVARVNLPGFKTVSMQSLEYTTTFVPVVAAVMRSESSPHVKLLLSTLARIFNSVHGKDHAEFATRAVQLHKDFAKSLEAGRRAHMPRSRPVGDWAHFARNMTAKSKQAGIGRDQVATTMQLSYRTKYIPTLELFNALWTYQFQHYGHRDWHQLRNNLTNQYFDTYTVKELKNMPVVRLLPSHEDSHSLWMADWFSGVLATVPGSSTGSQCVEGYHRAWDHFIGRSSTSHEPMAAVSTYQSFINQLTTTETYAGTTPISFHDSRDDPREFVSNGLIALCEVTAKDIWQFRQNGNYVVLRSTTMENTYYVVFRQTPSPQDYLRRLMHEDTHVNKQMTLLAKQRRHVHFGRTAAAHSAVLTGTDVVKILQTAWALNLPAARPVDTAAASMVVKLLELSGDALQHKLHELGVLGNPTQTPVDMKRLSELFEYDVVIMGNRAAYADAQHNAKLCSCGRFAKRHSCCHTVFVETLNIEGFQAATITDMVTRGLGFSS